MDTDKLEFNGLHVSPFEFGHQRAQVDLLLRIVEAQDKLEMTIEYSTDLFRRVTIERFVQRYLELIEQVTSDVQVRLQDLSISHDYKELVLQIDQGDFDFPSGYVQSGKIGSRRELIMEFCWALPVVPTQINTMNYTARIRIKLYR
ncbi:condensation domain-containing protein [Brevibacillus laterosporus]|uniref:condensation domain-containing protein n=1 Tax=Brevibacillus laterosporus TaxID=1465 RepID=UPI00264FD6DD|nr:condensation domain-containing protein [Brevibacillus laterosporus]MDN9012751.1 condensation domain-containing protein [Brevibacillus laterosporus]MDO0943824.1 condensation domain-containing protein [Brevibacillus laterosporus]